MTTSPTNFLSDDASHGCNPAAKVYQHTANANAGESELLEKLTELIKGIAPSSCKLTCAEMWESIERHKNLLQLPSVEFPVFESTPKVYLLNSGDASERIAELSMKLQSKFVQSETMSSYSIWAESSRQFASNIGNRRPFTGVSPGRRLSHLAKRRQMFSKANLQQLAQNEPKNHRLAIKTTVGQRNLDLRPNMQPPLPKRALFQSPDEPPVRPGFQTVAKRVPRRRLFADLKKNEPVQELPHGGGTYDVSSWLATQPFVNNRKRAREDSLQESNPKRRCPRRSLDFSDASPSQASQISSHSSSTPVPTLTNVHKQKLLWAVATALKEKKITHKHEDFKERAKKLFNHCRKNLANILALQVPSGTTEKMLSYARQHIDDILTNSNVTEASKIVIATGKENVNRTPKRVMKPRNWRSCIKSRQKLNPLRLNRSLSCDDLKENIGCKRKREEDSREIFREIGNTPAKENESDILKTAVIVESPEVDDGCVQASQEETEPCLFPALVRNLPAPKSPDLFESDEMDAHFPSLEIPPLSNVLESIPADESACPEDMTELLDLSCSRNEITEVEISNTVGEVEHKAKANESGDCVPTCTYNCPGDMTELLDLSCIRNETTEQEISSINENDKNAHQVTFDDISATPIRKHACPDDMAGVLDLRCIRDENELEISSINVEGDVEDNENADESSDDEGEMCTSTPMVSVPKRVLRRNKPAWKVESGPGLKIRVRLSKEWDIVGRRTPGISLESTNPEIDLKETVAETQVKHPFLRVNSIDTTGSSSDAYNLMELRDKLQIEQTLAADPSDMSFFESSPSSQSNSDTPTKEVSTIVEISPEITINCYKRKRFSVFESDSSEDDDPRQERKIESDDENVPLSQLIEQNGKSEEPMIRLIGNNTQVEDGEKSESQLPGSILDKTDAISGATLPQTEQEVSEDENLPLSRLVQVTKQEPDSEDDLPLSQLSVDNSDPKPTPSVKKLTLETYKARRSGSVSSEGSKKIYNIRLKKKGVKKSSNDENANPAVDVHATIENSERIIQQTFSEFAYLIHQKMQSTITDSSDFESKIEKLNKLVEMSIVQQQLFTYFKEKSLEIREKLSPLRLKD